MEGIRLQKFIADAGIASRRKAEELILQGRVRVNGMPANELGTKVTGSDIVEVDGRRVYKENKKIYVKLNKPSGYVTTSRDQFGRPTVLDLVKGVRERIYPVGRLDYDTSGLILLTNDGDLTYRLTHPSHEIEKVYLAQVKGIPGAQQLETFRRGLRIEDYITSPAQIEIVRVDGSKSTLKITIHEGRNRQVRKMCDAIGHPVIFLQRTAIGKIMLGDLAEGCWRHLDKEEMDWLGL